ncbi:MAG: alanine--glyoxylate aminotransferase family protein [Dehalococcoidia bacterium]
MNLRIPGPTPVPAEVAQAGAAEMVDHRGPEFAAIMERVTTGVKEVFQTKNDLAILTASGSGAMEAAVVNHISPGEEVIVVTVGEFGKRFLDLTNVYGARPIEVAFEAGEPADPNRIEEVVKANPQVQTVLVTHNETSTGITNPLKDIAKAVKGAGRFLIVDAISSLSSIPVEADAWDLDVVLSGSQKGWMVAPGLAFVSMSERSKEVQSKTTTPRFYLDLKRAVDSAARGQTPWTPAVSLFFQMDKAIELLKAEGMENVYARHHRHGERVRSGLQSLGLTLFAREGYRSDTVTAVLVPDGVDVANLRKVARSEFGLVLAGGQGPLASKLFRFGHLGYCTDEAVEDGLAAVAKTLEKLKS